MGGSGGKSDLDSTASAVKKKWKRMLARKFAAREKLADSWGS